MNSTHFFPSQKMAPPFTQLLNSKTNKSFPISLSFTPISHLRAAKNASAVPCFPCCHPSLSQRYILLGSLLYTTSQPESLCTPPLHRTCFPPSISSGIYFSTHKTWITSCPISTETPMLSKSLGVKLNHLLRPISDLANVNSCHCLLSLDHANLSPPLHVSTCNCPHLGPLFRVSCVWLLLVIRVSAPMIPSQESPPWPTWSLPNLPHDPLLHHPVLSIYS